MSQSQPILRSSQTELQHKGIDIKCNNILQSLQANKFAVYFSPAQVTQSLLLVQA